MLYKVGDQVKIKKREELKKCCIVVESMLPYAEQIVTITYVDDWEEFYNIDIDKDNFRWDDKCFCGRVLPDLPKEFELQINLEKPDKDIMLIDILYERLNQLEERIKILERKADEVKHE